MHMPHAHTPAQVPRKIVKIFEKHLAKISDSDQRAAMNQLLMQFWVRQTGYEPTHPPETTSP